MNGSRIKVGIVGDLHQPGLKSKNFLRSKSAQGNLWHLSKQEVIPTRFFLLLRQPFFACLQLSDPWQSTGGVNRTFSHIATIVRTSHMISHAPAWVKLCLPLKTSPHLVTCRDFLVVLYTVLIHFAYTFQLLLNVVSTKNLRRSTRPWS